MCKAVFDFFDLNTGRGFRIEQETGNFDTFINCTPIK